LRPSAERTGWQTDPEFRKTIDPLAKRVALVFFILLQMFCAGAQSTTDSSHLVDSPAIHVVKVADSSPVKPVIRKTLKINVDSPVVYHTDSLRFSAIKPVDLSGLPLTPEALLRSHPYFNFYGKALHVQSLLFERTSNEGMFYLLVGMLFFFAIFKLFFDKYLANLLTLFFRASIRQQQLREQVLQSPFPSLLLNVLFTFSAGLYGAFLLRYYHYGNPEWFWFHFLYCAGLLAVLYLLKYVLLRVSGWIFNINRAAETYLFVVFLTNKIIGIFLLPFLVLIAFSGPFMTEVGVTLSVMMIGLFYIYRFIASYAILHKEIKISGLYFFLYLCAFEIAPLLLIYKVLVNYLEKAY
jgi:hypothetical protein